MQVEENDKGKVKAREKCKQVVKEAVRLVEKHPRNQTVQRLEVNNKTQTKQVQI